MSHRSDVAADRADARRQEAAARRYEPGYGMFRGPNGPLIRPAQYFGNVEVFDPAHPPAMPNYSIQEIPQRITYEKDGLIVPREQSAYTQYDSRTNTYYEPLPGGALRVPPGGKAPPGYAMDHVEGSAWIALQTKPVLDNGNGWAYSILTIHRWPNGNSYIRPTRYGVYTSKDECEQARTKKLADMETNGLDVNGPVKVIQGWHSTGDHGPLETVAPQDCKPYTDQKPQLDIAVNQH
jgi:hypothetical protein